MKIRNQSIAKMLPHNIEAEQAVLGCAMIDGEAPIGIVGALSDTDFYTEAHQTIFEAMSKIYENNTPIDFVTLTDQLEKTGGLEAVGGIEYITSLTNVVPSAANYKHYVEIVKRDSVLRKLISSGQKIIENSYGAEDKETAIAFAEKEVYDIAEKEDQSSLEHISGAINAVIEKLDMIAKDGESMKGLSTGFDDLDEVTNGLHGSDLILIAARPGVGKTSLAMNIINNVAINEKAKCAVFSLEMPRTQIAQRSLFSVSSVSMGKGLKGNLTSEEWKSVWLAKKQISEAAIYVDDSSMNTPVDILSKCRRLKRESGLDLVMIDYLQLMNGSGKAKDNRQQEISEITRSLKIAAKELNVPIIVLSQLSRSVEARKDHRPMLSDLRESGAIEQDADIVMFIYKADMYNDVVSEDEPGVCELIIAKHRNGSLATVKLKWIGELTKFVGLHDKTFKASPAKNIEKSKPTEQNSPILEEIPAEDLENLDDLW